MINNPLDSEDDFRSANCSPFQNYCTLTQRITLGKLFCDVFADLIQRLKEERACSWILSMLLKN